MVANPPNEDGQGIVPRAARYIFEKYKNNHDPLTKIEIEVQMIEIYNEHLFGATCMFPMSACVIL